MNPEEVKLYYGNHSIGETIKFFNTSRFKLIKFLEANNIPQHTAAENQKLYQQNNGNSYSIACNKKFEDLINSIDKNELEEFYRNHSKVQTMKEFNLSKVYFDKVFDFFGIETLSASEIQKNLYKDGVKKSIFSDKEYQKELHKKIEETNLIRYGSKSPFGSKEVQEKTKHTVLNKYGVENVFQAPEIIDKIAETKYQKYGGHGFDSEEIRQKYIYTMNEKYGVDWGCLTSQCITASSGGNSKPNNAFANLLDRNNITYKKEFILNNYRYDFKIGNILIEINPSYTHNNTLPFKNSDKFLDKNYHQNKSLNAEQNGFRCIHIWDWDDCEKIISLLQDKDIIYARKCRIEEVPEKEAFEFINKYHLQGYARAKIKIGLYYNDNLVSIMTFDKPRYNKNYDFELVRYCASKNITGGAEKIFTYFKNNYEFDSIISYCDRSKFIGDIYYKLGFTSKDSYQPSKHWFNLKTRKHITDNLLRQRGFDQLFGKEYGCYGKDTSNMHLMLEHDFIEIYDCGQQSFIYKK